jgi:hypothetical protein
MNHSRRDFLRKTTLLAAVLPLRRLSADAAPGPAIGRKRGLLFDEGDLPRIRANIADPRFAACWQTMVSPDLADDADFLAHHVRFNHHSDDMLRVRAILERSAFVYAVNADPRHLEIAKLAARRLLDYPKWDMFLEGGTKVIGIQRASEATIALAFTLDWLGDALSAVERAEIERDIENKGAAACFRTLYGMKYPDRVKGWSMDPDDAYGLKVVDLKNWPLILNSTNLKIIPTAALGIAGCLFRGRNPQADVWLDLARSSARAFSPMYGSDGSFGEGVSYWGYTTLHLALFAEVLWRTCGIDDRHLINYPGTIRFALAMTMPRFGEPPAPHGKKQGYVGVQGVPVEEVPPRYDIVNFGDANVPVEISTAAWVARTHGDPVAQTVARDIGQANSHYGMIWYDPAAKSAPPEPALLDDRMANDRVVSRSGWTAADGVVALRSGGPANHEHADRNSVVFKAHGDRLLNDPFRAAYQWTLPRWKLRLTGAHTAVLIDGKGHEYNDGHEGTNASLACALVTAFRTGPGWMTVTSDATDAYRLVNRAVSRVERTLVFIKPDILLFLDRVDLRDVPGSVQARFQVFNDDNRGSCAVAGATFRIDRPFATLHARVAAAGDFKIDPGSIDLPATEGVFPFAEVGTAAGLTHVILTACTAAPSGGAHGEIMLSRDGGGWRAQGEHRGRTIDVRLSTDGPGAPAISV